jgi:hypothetical protein
LGHALQVQALDPFSDSGYVVLPVAQDYGLLTGKAISMTHCETPGSRTKEGTTEGEIHGCRYWPTATGLTTLGLDDVLPCRKEFPVLQVVQIAGAAMVLAAFGLVHAHRLTPAGVAYFLLNLAGSLALFVSAVAETQWGFIVLELAWAGISARGLVEAVREA